VEFAAIADWADSDSCPVAFMCREPGVSRSGLLRLSVAATVAACAGRPGLDRRQEEDPCLRPRPGSGTGTGTGTGT
jgi:hypothetical protein